MTRAATAMDGDRGTQLPRDTDRERGLMGLAELGLVPDALIRIGIRRLLKQRLDDETARGDQAQVLREKLSTGPIAVKTTDANRQHYEVPAVFYQHCLGHRLKYSGCYWPDGVSTLNQAEDAALALVCKRAELADGLEILELGCGWGSLTLWMAEHYPHARITAVSNSASQRAFILSRAAERGLGNVNVITTDINAFEIDRSFDRVVSVEMFEHMANHHELMRRVAGWLKDDGRLFVHVFTHKRFTYLFEQDGQSNWMGRHFFTGGIMPGHGYLPGFTEHLRCEADWWQEGTHYQKTAEAWLTHTDRARDTILEVFKETYGLANAKRWLQRWRIFYMACAELWGYRGGSEWGVSHYRFCKASEGKPQAGP